MELKAVLGRISGLSSGMITPPVINAICNALGVKDVPMPASPYNVWKAAQSLAR